MHDDAPGGLTAAIERAKARTSQTGQVEQARAAGAAGARAEARALFAICKRYGRTDLFRQVVGMSAQEAEQHLIGELWATGQASARSGVRPA